MKFEQLINLIEDLVINKIRLEKINNEYEAKELNQVLTQEILTTSSIQDIVKKITMVPISMLFNRIEKSSNDLISSIGKDIKIEFIEDKTEIDNSIFPAEMQIDYVRIYQKEGGKN
jgi:two-component system chemotaxis sensor kinase CheA